MILGDNILPVGMGHQCLEQYSCRYWGLHKRGRKKNEDRSLARQIMSSDLPLVFEPARQ